MKYIKNRQKFLNEAKIRDVILPRQAKAVISTWGEKFLDYEEIIPTSNIQQGKWKLSYEDKMRVLKVFFDCDIESIYTLFKDLPDKFVDIVSRSINLNLITDIRLRTIIKDINIKSPTIDQIGILYDNVFRKLSVSDTKADEMWQKDENGKVIRNGDGEMIKISKEKGDPVFTGNLIGIIQMANDYNNCYPEEKVEINFQNTQINRLRGFAADNTSNPQFEIDYEIFKRDLYLSINHNPKDILNMSISKFYASCQHLYSGGYRQQVLGNVFDPNSIPAFLVFDTPIFWDNEIISNHLPLTRMMIRNIETFSDSEAPRIYFDRAYVDRMKDIFEEIIEKYTENKANVGQEERGNFTYMFTPDIDIEDSSAIQSPYMDRLKIETRPYIGVNTKILYLNRSYDWSKIRISPQAKIKELIIETIDIPEDLMKIPLNPDWIKFKYLTINTLNNFKNLKTDSIAFDKCRFETKIFDEINANNPNIKKLQVVSCDISGDMNFSQFKSLEELQFIYTLDNVRQLGGLIENLSIKKIIISGDLIKDKASKSYINSLKKKMTVEILGPVI